jgi:hypothetical protein
MKLVPFLLLAVCLMTPTKAWFSGDGGLTMWDHGCWWKGTPIAEGKPALAEQCGGVCISTHGCRKFNWQHGFCYMYDDSPTLEDGNGKT